MKVLPRIGVAGGGRPGIVQAVRQAEAGFQPGVGAAGTRREAGVAQAVVGRQPGRDGELVLQVGGQFCGADGVGAIGASAPDILPFGGGDESKVVVGGRHAGPQGMAVGKEHVEIGLQAQVANAAAVLRAVEPRGLQELLDDLLVGYGEVERGADGGDVYEGAAAELSVVADGQRPVAPVEAVGLLGAAVFIDEGEAVLAEVAADEQLLPVVEVVVDLEVAVVEVQFVVLTAQGIIQQVEVGTAAGDQHAYFFTPPDGALQRQAGGEQADPAPPVPFLAVALLHAQVDHGGDAAAEAGGVLPLVEGDGLQRVGVEDRQEAEEVKGVVYRGAVEQDQVLPRGAAADEQSAEALAGIADARQELE